MPKESRVATGVPGLDEMLSGGFVPGSAVLVRGAPGCGKTSFGLQYLVHGARNNQPGSSSKAIASDGETYGYSTSANKNINLQRNIKQSVTTNRFLTCALDQQGYVACKFVRRSS